MQVTRPGLKSECVSGSNRAIHGRSQSGNDVTSSTKVRRLAKKQ
jgi:hypothetical protein